MLDYYKHLIADNDWKQEFLSKVFSKDLHEEALELIQDKVPCRLFKYKFFSENDIYTLDNLYKDKIIFRKYTDFNDPYDSFVGIDIDVELEGMYFMGEQLDLKGVEKENKKYKIASFVNKILYEKYMCCCFSEVNDSILMWSHYANEHKGFCIEYDFNELLALYGGIYPIVYEVEMTHIEQIKEGVVREDKSRLFTKYIDWAYEREWRSVKLITDNDCSNPCKLYNTPKPVAIYMGDRMSISDKNKLLKLCKDRNIKLYQMKKEPNKYKMDAFEILLNEV